MLPVKILWTIFLDDVEVMGWRVKGFGCDRQFTIWFEEWLQQEQYKRDIKLIE